MSTPPPAPDGQPAYTPPPADPAYTAPPAAPAYAAPPAAPAYAGAPGPSGSTKGPKGLGVIAFFAAVVAVILGSILTFVGGLQLGAIGPYADTSGTTTTIDPNTLPADVQQSLALGAILVALGYGAMGVFALWGFIQGIIAAVKNRGRGWGIAAIVVAVLAAVPVSVFLAIGTAAGIAPYVS